MIGYGGISVLNAISSGIGSVIPINLYFETKIVNDILNINEIDKIILEKVFKTKITEKGIRKKSNIPMGVGLKSSSAYTVSLIGAFSEFYNLKLSNIEIAKLSSKISKKMGISITGAFDDALASISSMFVITNNFKNKIIKIKKTKKMKVIIAIPEFKRPENIKERLKKFDFSEAINYVMNGDIEKGAILNGYLVGKALGYPVQYIDDLLNLGSKMVSYSGNGPAIYAVVNNNNIEKIIEYMKKTGKIILTETR
ncbi:MAG: shikimate kinase [Thermoplasmata archaeon]